MTNTNQRTRRASRLATPRIWTLAMALALLAASAGGAHVAASEPGPPVLPGSEHGLLFDAASGQFYLDLNGNASLDYPGTDLLYADQSANWSWDAGAKALSLDAMAWETPAALALTLLGDMTVVADGVNTFRSTAAAATSSVGILWRGSGAITGSGELNAQSGDAVAYSTGIDAYRLTIAAGTVNATAGRGSSSQGVLTSAAGGLTVNGGTLNATGGTGASQSNHAYGIFGGPVTVAGGRVDAAGLAGVLTGMGVYSYYGVTIAAGSLTASGPTGAVGVNPSLAPTPVSVTAPAYNHRASGAAADPGGAGNLFYGIGGVPAVGSDPAYVYDQALGFVMIESTRVAALDDLTVTGAGVAPLPNGQTATVTLYGDTAQDVDPDDYLWVAEASDWFAVLPPGVHVDGESEDGGSQVWLAFTGTPTAGSTAPFELTIPGMFLVSGMDLAVQVNPAARFDITPPPVWAVALADGGSGDSLSSVYAFLTAVHGDGSAPRLEVVVTNTGNQPAGPITAAITPPGLFTVNGHTSPATHGPMAVGAEWRFSVEPAVGLATGAHAATLTLDGPNGIAESINLTFTVAKAPGAAVAAPVVAALATDSVTVDPVAPPANGQAVEYAISTTGTAPASGWQADATFGGLASNTVHHVFARAQEDANHTAGVAASVQARTYSAVDPSALAALIVAAQDRLDSATYGDRNGDHDPDQEAHLQAAVDSACQVVADPYRDAGAVDDAVRELSLAIAGFDAARVAVDFTALDSALAGAEALVKGDHTDDSWEALQIALQEAREVRTTGHVTQAEADQAASCVNSAVAALRSTYRVMEHFGDFTGAGTSSAKVDADSDKFVRLVRDGASVDAADYAVRSGSTIVTLSEAYLKTLVNGTHWYTAEYSDGTSEPIRLVDVAPPGEEPAPPGDDGEPVPSDDDEEPALPGDEEPVPPDGEEPGVPDDEEPGVPDDGGTVPPGDEGPVPPDGEEPEGPGEGEPVLPGGEEPEPPDDGQPALPGGDASAPSAPAHATPSPGRAAAGQLPLTGADHRAAGLAAAALVLVGCGFALKMAGARRRAILQRGPN
ncbi:MAG: hypothetical protein LBK95_12885 [Bifidobacteriaceae bacterium]|jgi:hypothetical protein|nr:hypothetical protein [Bifidobacteriaceae bacterium]